MSQDFYHDDFDKSDDHRESRNSEATLEHHILESLDSHTGADWLIEAIDRERFHRQCAAIDVSEIVPGKHYLAFLLVESRMICASKRCHFKLPSREGLESNGVDPVVGKKYEGTELATRHGWWCPRCSAINDIEGVPAHHVTSVVDIIPVDDDAVNSKWNTPDTALVACFTADEALALSKSRLLREITLLAITEHIQNCVELGKWSLFALPDDPLLTAFAAEGDQADLLAIKKALHDLKSLDANIDLLRDRLERLQPPCRRRVLLHKQEYTGRSLKKMHRRKNAQGQVSDEAYIGAAYPTYRWKIKVRFDDHKRKGQGGNKARYQRDYTTYSFGAYVARAKLGPHTPLEKLVIPGFSISSAINGKFPSRPFVMWTDPVTKEQHRVRDELAPDGSPGVPKHKLLAYNEKLGCAKVYNYVVALISELKKMLEVRSHIVDALSNMRRSLASSKQNSYYDNRLRVFALLEASKGFYDRTQSAYVDNRVGGKVFREYRDRGLPGGEIMRDAELAEVYATAKAKLDAEKNNN